MVLQLKLQRMQKLRLINESALMQVLTCANGGVLCVG